MRQSITQSLKAGFVVLVVAAVGTTGIALAQTGDEVDPADPQAVTEDGFRRGGDRGFRGGFALHGARGFGGIVDQVADATGLTVQEILDQLGDGATIADLAAANGSSGDAIVAAMLADLSDRLDAAVADERITADEAAEKLAAAEERLTELVETPDPIGAALEERQTKIEDGLVRRAEQQAALLDVLGVTEDELRAAFLDGQTLAEVAEAQGVDVADVVEVLVAPIAEKLDEAVIAGDLTQAEADEKLAAVTERTTEKVEEGQGFGPGRRGKRGHGPRSGGDGAGLGGVDAGFGIQAGVTIDA